jgi:hypothetical protein
MAKGLRLVSLLKLNGFRSRKWIIPIGGLFFLFVSVLIMAYIFTKPQKQSLKTEARTNTSVKMEPAPNLEVNFTPGKELSVMIEGFKYPSEINPIIIPNPKETNTNERLVILPGSNSHICITDKNILAENIIIPPNNCRIDVSASSIHKVNNDGSVTWLNPLSATIVPWTFSYNGIFTAIANPRTNSLFFGRYFESQDLVYRYVNGNSPNCDKAENNPNQYLYQSGIRGKTNKTCTCAEQKIDCQKNYDPDFCDGENNICPGDPSDSLHTHSYATFLSGLAMGWSSYSPIEGYKLEPMTDEGPVIWPYWSYLTPVNDPTER